jgi:hypothetical protein
VSASTGTQDRAPGIGTVLGVLGGYLCLVLVLTWPLGAHLATHLPDTAPGCRFDALKGAWLLAHWSRVLAHPCWTCLLDGNIYHPTQHALLYGPLALGAIPYFAPPFLLTGNPALALNLTFLVGVAATATALHLVVARWTGSHAAAFVAGLAFLTTRWVLWEWIPATPWFASLACFPLIIFLAARRDPRLQVRWALAAAVALQCLTDPIYVAPAVLCPLTGLTVLRLARADTRRSGLRLLGCLVFAALVVGGLYAGHLSLHNKGGVLSIWGFPLPPPELPGDLLTSLSPTAVPLAGWLLAAAGLGSVVARRGTSGHFTKSAWAHALWWTLAGILISLPPVIRLFDARVPLLPLQWLDAAIHLYSRLRVPARLRVASLFGLAILAGLGFNECARRLAALPVRRFRAGALSLGLSAIAAGAMLAEYRAGLPPLREPLPAAYPLARAITPSPVLLPVLQRPGGPLLELPLAQIRLLPVQHARAMYHSIFHRRRLVNGYNAYFPPGFVERMDLAGRLPDPTALTALAAATGLELVLVHGDALSAAEGAAWSAAAEGRGDPRLRLVARDGEDLLFRVDTAIAPSEEARPRRAAPGAPVTSPRVATPQADEQGAGSHSEAGA